MEQSLENGLLLSFHSNTKDCAEIETAILQINKPNISFGFFLKINFGGYMIYSCIFFVVCANKLQK